jgi:rare lipoprotein A
VQTGIASWYGPGFHGKRTANGEIYDQNALTAAHRSLPLGTNVIVTNLESGQAIEVRINDRGPFVEGRIIDLSLAAAKSIGVYAPGTALVRIGVLSAPTPRLAVLYAVQVGSYTNADKASGLKQALTPHFSSVYISPLSSGRFRYYQVRLGPFTERAQAERQARSVSRAGLQSVVVEEDDRWAEW